MGPRDAPTNEANLMACGAQQHDVVAEVALHCLWEVLAVADGPACKGGGVRSERGVIGLKRGRAVPGGSCRGSAALARLMVRRQARCRQRLGPATTQ